MDFTHYTGTYHGSRFGSPMVDLFFTDVTITIRSFDYNGQYKDLHILVEDVVEVKDVETTLEVVFKNKSMGFLLIDNPKTIDAFKLQYRKKKFLGKTSYHLWHSFNAKIVLLTAAVIGVILAFIFWFLPWLGLRLLQTFPKEFEVKLGESLLKPSIGDAKIDSAKTLLLNKFYKSLDYPTGYPIHITVVESEELNAFALPGGPIVVYTAILNKMQTPEELAALLSHEAAHIQNRHTLRNMLSTAGTRILLGLLLGDQSGAVALLAEQANELKGLAYSRSLETEADLQGLAWMQQKHMDPNGMLRLMNILQTASGGSAPASFLSTHPVFEERTAAIKKVIREHSGDSYKVDTNQLQIFKAIPKSDF